MALCDGLLHWAQPILWWRHQSLDMQYCVVRTHLMLHWICFPECLRHFLYPRCTVCVQKCVTTLGVCVCVCVRERERERESDSWMTALIILPRSESLPDDQGHHPRIPQHLGPMQSMTVACLPSTGTPCTSHSISLATLLSAPESLTAASIVPCLPQHVHKHCFQ